MVKELGLGVEVGGEVGEDLGAAIHARGGGGRRRWATRVLWRIHAGRGGGSARGC